jgi:DtxR family Mn-dependent transcriptional regulator
MAHAGSPSAVAEAYLTTIYTTHRDGEAVRSHRLAERLRVKPPTVTETLRRLSAAGYLRNAGRVIELTERGQTLAERVLRRHFIAERWLTDALGMGWAEADEEAHRVDHGLSDRVAERLFEVLGRPKTCPHGNPIPGAGITRPSPRSLQQARAGELVTMERITEEGEEDAELLHKLERSGMRPGSAIRVEAVTDASLRLRVGGKALSIRREAARWIRVRPQPGHKRKKIRVQFA